MPASRYNLVILGAGPAGLVAAAGAAGLGAKVALVEKHLMGGDCLNYGCVPSKALIRSARAIADVRGAAAFGVDVPPGARVDFPAVMERMRRLRAWIGENDSAERFRSLGVDIFPGQGRFSGADTVDVNGQVLRFKKALIATGARAALPPIPGLAGAAAQPLTNETIFSLTRLPPRLAVIGAGPVGCEMAQTFRRFGSEVHLIETAPQILPREDADAADIVRQAFLREGVNVHLGVTVLRIEVHGGEKMIAIADAGGVRAVHADSILIATGRTPNVEGLNLERAGVTYDPAGVTVDDFLRTSNPRIYAAGDVCAGPYKFTHAADVQARLVLRNALFPGRARAGALAIPWCTYTDPEIAHVGISETAARQCGLDVQTMVQPLKEVDRAILDGETDGIVKIHLKKGTDKILGATLVARHAGEMINELTLAMTAGIGLGTIARTVHPYPTQAESIRRAGDAWNRARLSPLVKKMLSLWFRLQR